MSFLRKFSDIVDKIMTVLATISLFGFVIVMLIQVFQRNFTPAHAWSFADSLCRHFFIWATFTGAAMVSKRRKQISITLIPDILKGFPKKALTIFNYLLVIVILAFAIYWGGYSTIVNISQNMDTVPYPAAVVYAAIPIGMAATCIQEIINMIVDLDSWRKEGKSA